MRTAIFAMALAAPVAAEPLYLEAPAFPLPLRAAPDGEIIADLPPGALVETTGETGAWVRVPLAESDAWAARDALRPVDVPRLGGSRLPEGLLCTGTEPFWSLRLEEGGATFTMLGNEAEAFGIFAIAPAVGRQAFPALVTMMEGAQSLLAVIRPEACSDGMSDRTQPWEIDLVQQRPDDAGGVLTLRSGCCRLPAPQ